MMISDDGGDKLFDGIFYLLDYLYCTVVVILILFFILLVSTSTERTTVRTEAYARKEVLEVRNNVSEC